jgi:hypothetical protein
MFRGRQFEVLELCGKISRCDGASLTNIGYSCLRTEAAARLWDCSHQDGHQWAAYLDWRYDLRTLMASNYIF